MLIAHVAAVAFCCSSMQFIYQICAGLTEWHLGATLQYAIKPFLNQQQLRMTFASSQSI